MHTCTIAAAATIAATAILCCPAPAAEDPPPATYTGGVLNDDQAGNQVTVPISVDGFASGIGR